MYNAKVNYLDAEKRYFSGTYYDVLRACLKEQSKATLEGRRGDVVQWSVLAVQASRDLGRVTEALTHAQWAMDAARSEDDPSLLCRARYGMALGHKGERDFDSALENLRAGLEVLPSGASDHLRATVLLETSATCLEAGLRSEAEGTLAKGSALVQWLREPRLLAWSLFLRSSWESPQAADLQLSAAYEIARTVRCPELMWQILWRLAERAEQQGRDRMQEDFLWNAFRIVSRLAAPLDPADATAFWRQGARRAFLDTLKTKFGGQFLSKVMADGTPESEDATRIIRDIGFDPNTIPDFGRPDVPQL